MSNWMDNPEFNCYVDRHGYTVCNNCDYEECTDADVKQAKEQDEKAYQWNMGF